MFGKSTLADIEAYLYGNIKQAKEQSETGILFTLLNEMIGFCRDTTQKDKTLKYCAELLQLLDEMKLEGSVEYATALLNIANAYRAFDLLKTSLELFEQVERMQFEDAQFYVPSRYDEVLTQCYGDYMKLPPADQQIAHHYYTAYLKDENG
jgi:hypothetical protein